MPSTSSSVYTEKEIEELKETFNLFDTNKDGEIDVFELRNMLQKMHVYPTHYELQEMIRSVDHDHSATIDFEEFLVLMQSRVGNGGPDEDLRKAFEQFDKRNTGFIDKESMKQTMIEFDNALSDKEIDAIYDEVDLDEDGRISFREFQRILRS